MTENWKFRRRTFLKHGAQAATLAGLSGLFPETLRRALAIEPDIRTGTIQDVQHVVILMQENRSFDHYFGHLNGVRGFNDPRALKRQDGKPVWYQNYKYEFSPYHWDTKVTSAQWVSSQNHEWSAFHAIWNQGRNDKWMAVQYPEAMGYFKRGDIPYYYALADAFTLCEAYYQSMMGPTNPNRLYHMSGRAAPSGDGKDVHIGNDMGDGTIGASGTVDWTTYPERLSAAGVDWRVYQEGGYRSSSLWYLYVDAYWKYRLQEQNNYDCNALAWFRNFKNAPRDSDLWQRAMLARGVDQLRKDVQENTLPQVSWIVAPYCYCEHPWWGPSFGEYYVTRVLEALTSNPEVWARTVFILNYDEGDGFYDHASAPVPPWKDGVGLSTVSTAGEIEASSGLPIGLGHRVPLIAISPWSKGGKVSAEVFDHTSVLRFLERRFGVVEENISPWRRAVCGDLTSLFDFQGAGDTQVAPRPDQRPAERRAQGGRLLAAVLPAQPQVLVLRAEEPARPGKGPAPYPRGALPVARHAGPRHRRRQAAPDPGQRRHEPAGQSAGTLRCGIPGAAAGSRQSALLYRDQLSGGPGKRRGTGPDPQRRTRRPARRQRPLRLRGARPQRLLPRVPRQPASRRADGAARGIGHLSTQRQPAVEHPQSRPPAVQRDGDAEPGLYPGGQPSL